MTPSSSFNPPPPPPPTRRFIARYTRRDLILYALGIGCTSGGDGEEGKSDDSENGDDELRFVYERHPNFEAFPTFLLALAFVAEPATTMTGPTTNFGVRPFPPAHMTPLIPEECFAGGNKAAAARAQNGLLVLHISQSLELRSSLPDEGASGSIVDPPTTIEIAATVASVVPKDVGTFVVTDVTYSHETNDGRRVVLATARSTALVAGLDPGLVLPYRRDGGRGETTKKQKRKEEGASNPSNPRRGGANLATTTIARYVIPRHAALLYRLSGDYNRIHVEGDDALASLLGGQNDNKGEREGGGARKNQKTAGGPILHGLCTLGYATRAVLRHAARRSQSREGGGMPALTRIDCRFRRPVHVGDTLVVEVRDDGVGGDVRFRVSRSDSGGDGKTSPSVVVAEGTAGSESRSDAVVVCGGGTNDDGGDGRSRL